MKQAFSILGLLIVALLLLTLLGAGTTTEVESYTNELYGYSFEYPSSYEIREYTPEVVAIGTPLEDSGFEAVAEVSVITSEEEGGYENFEVFLFERTAAGCAADGPRVALFCEGIEQQQPVETASGLTGVAFYLERITESSETGEREVGGFGPLFAFNVSANIPESPFAALVVRPPYNHSAEEAESEIIRSIAETLHIDRVEDSLSSEELVLVSRVESRADETVIVADPVVWLLGDEARRAALLDTECSDETIEECVPSLNNNFYIRNLEEEEVRYIVSSDALISLQEGVQEVAATIGDVDMKLEALTVPLIFSIDREGDVVTRLEEVYTP